MTACLVEALVAARRLARRGVLLAAALPVALALLYAGVVRPVTGPHAALSAATALATLVVLIVSAGIVADDRSRGRLAMTATHPAPPAAWIVGRWLAVSGAGAATLGAASAILLAVARAPVVTGAVAASELLALAHVAALGSVAVALSCAAGPTAQVLLLLGFWVVGALPPEAAGDVAGAAWVAGLVRALWTALPSSWMLGRFLDWTLGAGAAAPAALVVLALQPALWLGAGARRLAQAELAVRDG